MSAYVCMCMHRQAKKPIIGIISAKHPDKFMSDELFSKTGQPPKYFQVDPTSQVSI